MAKIADRIRQVLKVRGISARELSRRAGIAETHVSQILKKSAANPDANIELRTLQAIARAANVSDQWLLTGEGSPDDMQTEAEAPQRSPAALDQSPQAGNIQNWPELLDAAKAIAPDVPAWAWDKATNANLMLNAPLTPVAVAELGRFYMRHGMPPRKDTKK